VVADNGITVIQRSVTYLAAGLLGIERGQFFPAAVVYLRSFRKHQNDTDTNEPASP
jgi:hypothetical protein